MAHRTQIITASGTIACAAAIGFFMQSSETAERRYGEALADADPTNQILDVEQITLTSGELIAASPSVPTSEAEVIKAAAPANLPEPERSDRLADPACEMTATARPVAAAMVDLSLSAACLPNERVTVHHNGMIFTQTTDAAGKLDVTLPALSQEALFIMAFINGEGAVAQTSVPELVDFDRMVLQWKGDTGFEIHAREFGADYGDTGHIWHGAPGEMADAITGKGGFVSRYGDADVPESLLAEVYSFPVINTGYTGTVDLTVEAEVTDVNCGLEIEAQTLQVHQGAQMKTRNLTLSVPECDAAGNFLVLNDLLVDLKVAAK